MAKTAFQKRVESVPAPGVPGDKADLSPHVYTETTFVAGDAAVTVGNFVWADPDNPDPAFPSGPGACKALSTGPAGALPLGLVERNLSFRNSAILDGATLVAPRGAALNIVKRGALFAVSKTAATRGQKVFASLADGAVLTGEATAAISGAVETSWEVVDGGAAGACITISNWSA